MDNSTDNPVLPETQEERDARLIKLMTERIAQAKAEVVFLTEGAKKPTNPEDLFTDEGQTICALLRVVEELTKKVPEPKVEGIITNGQLNSLREIAHQVREVARPLNVFGPVEITLSAEEAGEILEVVMIYKGTDKWPSTTLPDMALVPARILNLALAEIRIKAGTLPILVYRQLFPYPDDLPETVEELHLGKNPDDE